MRRRGRRRGRRRCRGAFFCRLSRISPDGGVAVGTGAAALGRARCLALFGVFTRFVALLLLLVDGRILRLAGEVGDFEPASGLIPEEDG